MSIPYHFAAEIASLASKLSLIELDVRAGNAETVEDLREHWLSLYRFKHDLMMSLDKWNRRYTFDKNFDLHRG